VSQGGGNTDREELFSVTSSHAELCVCCVTNMDAPIGCKNEFNVFSNMKVLLLDNVILAHFQITHLL
jgi:hypothetical protein